MASTEAIDVDPRLIQFMVPSLPESVRMARFHVWAVLSFFGLGDYADDAAIITSELVTNAVQHVRKADANTIGVAVAHVWDPASVVIVVSDSSPEPPVMRHPSLADQRGRGLQVVEALSVHWDWHLEPGGKSVLAILSREA